jgi:transglutaminase-like putative cysteine protease
MTAMLRSQGIPTKLVIGYAGDIYHAWISVYTEEKGWIENAIEFHGNEWVRMDPTFASTTGQGINFVDDTIVYNDLETY